MRDLRFATAEARVRRDDPEFAFLYLAMAEDGECDSFGEMESERVYRAWVEAGRPGRIREFIRDLANGPPDRSDAEQ